jgi:hypothetical protein
MVLSDMYQPNGLLTYFKRPKSLTDYTKFPTFVERNGVRLCRPDASTPHKIAIIWVRVVCCVTASANKISVYILRNHGFTSSLKLHLHLRIFQPDGPT